MSRVLLGSPSRIQGQPYHKLAHSLTLSKWMDGPQWTTYWHGQGYYYDTRAGMGKMTNQSASKSRVHKSTVFTDLFPISLVDCPDGVSEPVGLVIVLKLPVFVS